MYLQDWINIKFREIASELSKLVYSEPQSYSCGFYAGYKAALLDLDKKIDEGFDTYRSKCKCGDKYHAKGERCL